LNNIRIGSPDGRPKSTSGCFGGGKRLLHSQSTRNVGWGVQQQQFRPASTGFVFRAKKGRHYMTAKSGSALGHVERHYKGATAVNLLNVSVKSDEILKDDMPPHVTPQLMGINDQTDKNRDVISSIKGIMILTLMLWLQVELDTKLKIARRNEKKIV